MTVADIDVVVIDVLLCNHTECNERGAINRMNRMNRINRINIMNERKNESSLLIE